VASPICRRTKDYDDVVANRPLSFIAQINCADACKYDKDGLLPTKGMLYFFYDMATMKWGYDPKDKGSARVFYYSGDISELCKTEFPANLSSEYRIPEAPVAFPVSHKAELPDFEEFAQLVGDIDYKQWAEFDEAKAKMGFDSEEDEDEERKWGKTKLLGYANLVQGGMLLECETSSNGIYSGDGKINATEEEMRQYKQYCKQWQLLFQLGSIDIGNYELMWGDVGKIYFYIKIDDLKNLNFDNCWLVLQCG